MRMLYAFRHAYAMMYCEMMYGRNMLLKRISSSSWQCLAGENKSRIVIGDEESDSSISAGNNFVGDSCFVWGYSTWDLRLLLEDRGIQGDSVVSRSFCWRILFLRTLIGDKRDGYSSGVLSVQVSDTVVTLLGIETLIKPCWRREFC